MPGYLDTYNMAVGKGQLEGIYQLMETLQQEGLIRNDAELEQVVRGLRERVSGKPEFQPRIDPVRVRSRDINENFQQIFIDLYGLYNHISEMDNTVTSQQEVTGTLRQNVRKAIHRLSQDLRQFRFLRDNPDYTEVKFVDFADTRNLTTDRLKAEVDPYSRTLRLPRVRQDRHNELRGIEETVNEVEVVTSGVKTATSRSFKPEFALDQNNNSFWAEVVLADEPVKTTYTDGYGVTQTVDGLVVKSTIKFDRPQFVNNVQVLPFSPFPLQILDVRINGELWDGYTDWGESFDWFDFTGTRQIAEEVEVWFLQPNYTYANYQIPSWAYSNSFFWNQLVDDDLEDRYLAEAQIPLDERESLTQPGLGALIRARKDISDILENRDPDTANQAERVSRIVDAVVEVLDTRARPLLNFIKTSDPEDSRDTQDYVEIEKFEYVLGAFSIITSDVEYSTQGEYESPRFAILGNPVDIELEAEDRHVTPTGSSFQVTSLEYNVSLGPDKLVPVVPKGASTVTQEYLEVDPASRAGSLRLEPNGDVTLFANHVSQGAVTPTGNLVTVELGIYDPDIVYTVDYTPATGQDVVDVQAEFDSREQIEYFTETDKNGVLQLAYYPHIVYDIVNDETTWSRPDTTEGIWSVTSTGSAVTYDGFSYGVARSTLGVDITDSDTTVAIQVGDGSLFPSEGTLVVDDEYISYSTVTGDAFTDVVRGIEDTDPASHTAGTTIELFSQSQYEPVRLFVNGEKAKNISDYRTRNHPAFTNPDNPEADWEFIQIGRTIYLNKPAENATIEVQYRTIADYVSSVITLRNHQLGSVSRTPIVDRFNIRMKTENR